MKSSHSLRTLVEGDSMTGGDGGGGGGGGACLTAGGVGAGLEGGGAAGFAGAGAGVLLAAVRRFGGIDQVGGIERCMLIFFCIVSIWFD